MQTTQCSFAFLETFSLSDQKQNFFSSVSLFLCCHSYFSFQHILIHLSCIYQTKLNQKKHFYFSPSCFAFQFIFCFFKINSKNIFKTCFFINQPTRCELHFCTFNLKSIPFLIFLFFCRLISCHFAFKSKTLHNLSHLSSQINHQALKFFSFPCALFPIIFSSQNQFKPHSYSVINQLYNQKPIKHFSFRLMLAFKIIFALQKQMHFRRVAQST